MFCDSDGCDLSNSNIIPYTEYTFFQYKLYLIVFDLIGFRFHLSEHTNIHTGETPYSCPECGKRFHKRAQLRQHAQIHVHDSKKAVCDVCGLRFSRKSNLIAHAKTHVEGRTFPCKLCHMQFPSFSAMLSHRRQHSQEDIKNRIRLGLLEDKVLFS